MTMTLREKPRELEQQLRRFIEKHNLDGKRWQRVQQEAKRRQANSEFLDVSYATLERFSREFHESGVEPIVKAELHRANQINPKLLTFVRQQSQSLQRPAEEDPFCKGALLATRLLSFEAQAQGYLLPPVRDPQRTTVRQWLTQPVPDSLGSFLDGIEYYCGTESRLGAATTIAMYRAQHAHNLFSRADTKPARAAII